MAARKSGSKSKARTKPDVLQSIAGVVMRAEVGGVVLILLATVTLLSLLTQSNGVITAALINALQTLFGVGVWGFPIVTGVLGLWMVIRAIERLPDLPWERPAGLSVLFLAGIIGATLWLQTTDPAAGGQVGLLLANGIRSIIGLGGAWAVVAFLLIMGIVLLTDHLLPDIAVELWYQWQEWRQRPTFQPATIEPVLPLPSGQVPWWKRWLEHWQAPPLPPAMQPAPNLVQPDPPVRRVEPQRPAQAAASPAVQAAPRATQTTQPTSSGELPMPRIIGMGSQEYRLPRVSDMLKDWERRTDSDDRIRQQGRMIQETLALFGVPADFEGAYKGPSVTQYLIKPGYVERTIRGEQQRIKVKVSKIAGLANDLALALAAPTVRIEAPIPGTNYVGIEVPNLEGNIVGLKELMESETFEQIKGKLRIALGEDVKGQPITSDLARMPHLLIAGATGSGKSACINSIICCLLLTHTPDTLRFLMVDPKMVELSTYNGVPHLLSPVVTEVDKAAGVLFWAVKEMERRYTLFSKAGARDLVRYNEFLTKRGEKTLPYIVVVVDEMADLMMAAPEEVEKHICRLAQMARAVGIHLIIATQRPSVDVITGLIKANFPARIAFAVTSQTDSRVILDVPGAERLLGRGDMLFMASDANKLERLQGTWVSDEEISKVVRYWKGIRSLESAEPVQLEITPENSPDESASAPTTTTNKTNRLPAASAATLSQPSTIPLTGLSQPPLFDEIKALKAVDARDELFEEAVRVVQEAGRGSVSLLQRKLRIGYSRAARLVDQLEEAAILSPDLGNGQGREVLVGGSSQPTAELKPPRIIGGEADDDAATPKPRVWM
ncbi:MAG: DNA translocase FtsK 4TM domain-containing protein [Caldilineaceae bacterium]